MYKDDQYVRDIEESNEKLSGIIDEMSPRCAKVDRMEKHLEELHYTIVDSIVNGNLDAADSTLARTLRDIVEGIMDA